MNTYFSNKNWVKAYAFYLRMEVFVLEQGIPAELEFDNFDTDEREYVVIIDQEKPVGTIRYQRLDRHTIQPDRLCVSAAYRKQGFGKQLLRIIEDKGISEGCLFSELSAEISATDFYLNLGYKITSPPFLEDGIPCVKMTKKLLRT